MFFLSPSWCDFFFKYTFFFLAALPEDPEFTDVIENITVPAGRNIKLACSVKNLGSYKVRIYVSVYLIENIVMNIENDDDEERKNQEEETIRTDENFSHEF